MGRLVSVWELIRSQPESLRARLPRPGDGGSEPGQGPERADPEPLRPSVRLTAAAVAVFLLFGAAAATSVALSRSPTSSPRNVAAPATPITGMPALRPDVLMTRAGWSPAEIPDPAREPALPFPLPGRPAGPDDLVGENSASLLHANPSAGSVQGAVALVENFYNLLDQDPGRAATLLAPDLLGSDTEEFTRSWNALRTVRARQVRPGPNGSVIAELVATGPRGEHVVLRHRMTVEDGGTTPHIRAVELLTAELRHA